MDTIFEIAIVGAWIWVTVVSVVQVLSERRRWYCQHPAHGIRTVDDEQG